jgi:DNA-binding ferritin-like protein
MEERADELARRLQDAAERLRASAPPPPQPVDELSALEGLSHARVDVRRAQDAVDRIGALLRDLDDR